MNKKPETILKIFEAISTAIILVNGIALIIDKYKPKTIEELNDALNTEKISKNN